MVHAAKSKGFTLVELVVVLAIFFVILSVAASLFVSIVQQQKALLSKEELLNQASYVMEYVSRSLRTAVNDSSGTCLGPSYAGYDYLLTHFNSTSGFYEGVKFLGSDGVCHEFFLSSGALQESKNGQAAQNLFSTDFQVLYSRFIINGDKSLQGASKNDTVQPRITISLNIQYQINGKQETSVFQTTVSQSNLNVSNL